MLSWPASELCFSPDGLISPKVASVVRVARYASQTAAIAGVSAESSAPSASIVLANLSADSGFSDAVSAAAVHFSPTASGGRTEPILTARSGSLPVASSQRPIQPVETGWAGDAVCQMSIDRKWLWSGCG